MKTFFPTKIILTRFFLLFMVELLGHYAVIPFRWNDSAKVLTIGDRNGKFPGMLEGRTFSIVWVRQNHGGGVEPEHNPDVTVQYEGKRISIKKGR